MGLFDSFNPNFASSPQFQQGLLAMALASGNPRQAAGVQGLLQMQMQQEDRAAKQALLNQKIAEQQKKDNFFGGLMSNGVGNMTPEQVLQAKQYNVDAMPAVEYAKRGVQVQPGNGYIGQNGQFTYVPQVDKGIMLNPDGSAAQVNGYAQANAGIQGAQTQAQQAAQLPYDLARFQGQARANASNRTMQVYNPTSGQMEFVTESQVGDKAKGLSPMAGTPGDIQSPGYNGGSRAAANADAIAIMQRELMQPGVSPADQAAIRREIARMQQQTPAAANGVPDGNYAAGPSADAEAAAAAAKAGAVKQAESDVQSTQQRQSSISSLGQIIGTIDSVLKHPGLPEGTGLQGKIDPRNYVPGTDAFNFGVAADQLQGQAFIGAYEKLKGAGQITEVEGKKAENAIARLNRAQSTDAYKQALNDFKSVMQDALQRASGNGAATVQQQQPSKPAKTVVRTGMHGGRKVVQYSDGTTDYAD